jgi:REP element-mobilizing transposase RayT
MILAFHSIISAYGFWRPNEQRGSWSDFVRSWELFYHGPATKVDTHRSVAARPYDRPLKQQMRSSLAHPAVRFTDDMIAIIADAFSKTPYRFHALAIMRNHAHAVIEHTDRDIRRVVGHIKSGATRALRAKGFFTERPVWADHGWNVYLDSDEDVMRALPYVEGNPTRDGMPAQRYDFVIRYDSARSRRAMSQR